MRLTFAILCCAMLAEGCDHVATLVPDGGIVGDASALTGWTSLSAGSINLNAVSGLSDTAVWAVGDQGTIKHWDGSQVTTEPSGTTANLRAVFALDADDVYAVGDAGTILYRQSGKWTQVGKGVTASVLTGVWADSTRVVAVGSFGTIVLGGMTGYAVVPNKTYTQNIMGVTGVAGGSILMVGALGLVLQMNGMSLSVVPLTSFNKLLTGVVSIAKGSAWSFVGQQGAAFIDSSGPPMLLNGCPASQLRSVSSADGVTAWAVGWDGSVCKIANGVGTSYPYSDARWFNGVYAATPTSLWVVGASGTMLHGFPKNTSDGGASPSDGGAG
jgi:hypothetical protein